MKYEDNNPQKVNIIEQGLIHTVGVVVAFNR